MRSIAYIQIVPTRSSSGEVRKLKLGALTQGPPVSPEPGAMVVRLEIEADPALFAIPTAQVVLDGDPNALSMAVVPHPVTEDTDRD